MRIFSSGHIQENRRLWPPSPRAKTRPPSAAGDFGLFASHEGHAAGGAEERPGLSALLGWIPQWSGATVKRAKKSLERLERLGFSNVLWWWYEKEGKFWGGWSDVI